MLESPPCGFLPAEDQELPPVGAPYEELGGANGAEIKGNRSCL